MTALRDVCIIEFCEGVPGPLAGMRMLQLGATVIKVEERTGDWLRSAASKMRGSDVGAAFFELNYGKRSLLLDPQEDKAGPILQRLLAKADVFITDKKPSQLERLGVTWVSTSGNAKESIYLPNPSLITVSISAWGDRGPWSNFEGSELTAQAVAGYTRYLGAHDQPARRLGADVACAGTGIFAGQAILAALYARSRSGGNGQRITLSLLNSLLSLKSIHLAAQSDPDQYVGPRVGGASYPPEQGWKTRDDNIFFSFGGSVGATGRPGWVQFVEEAGFTRLLDDPRFDKAGRNSTGYGADVLALKSEYEQEFARYSADELVAMIRKHGGIAARYQSNEEAIRHEQSTALRIVRQKDDAISQAGARVEVRAFPARFSRITTSTEGDAPALGQHTLEILREFL